MKNEFVGDDLQNPQWRYHRHSQPLDAGRIRERAAEYWSGRNIEIEDVLKERLGSEIDVEHLWKDVGAQLDEGNIRLIIASDRIRPEVRRMIEYLNAEMRHAQILGLELNCYAEDDDSVIIAPRLIGQSTDLAERKSSSNKTTQWNEQRLREAFSTLDGEILVGRMNELLDWAVAKSLAVFSPATNPTFGIQGKAGIRIFSIYSDGGVYAFLEETRYREHESDRETLVRKLKELNLFDPNLDLATVASGRNMKRKIDELAPHEFGALMNLFEELAGT